jgi:hypothetical protein
MFIDTLTIIFAKALPCEIWHGLGRTAACIDRQRTCENSTLQQACAEKMFAALEYDDMWPDALVVSTVKHLRGSRALKLPPSWREVMPNAL